MGGMFFRSLRSLCKGNLFPALLLLLLFVPSSETAAQKNNNHLMFSVGAFYERGLEATIAYEHSGKYHNGWEYFAGYYLKYEDDPLAGHITTESFWNSYRNIRFGVAYKPCVVRGRNHHGNLRLGGSAGTNTKEFVGGLHVGYEHDFALKHGWELFFQIKEDVVFGGGDTFRTGIALGFKAPL